MWISEACPALADLASALAKPRFWFTIEPYEKAVHRGESKSGSFHVLSGCSIARLSVSA